MRAILLLVTYLALIAAEATEKKIVCYFPSGLFDNLTGTLDVSDTDPSLCTHLIYIYAAMEGDDIKAVDPSRDLPDNGGLDAFGRLNALRQKNPRLKIMIAIGDWYLTYPLFLQTAANSTSRDRFADNVVKFIKKWGFDGCDFKWEKRGKYTLSMKSDNYIELLKALRARFDREGLVLSAFVTTAEISANKSYNIPEMMKYLDFVNVESSRLHESWKPWTSLYSPLHASSSDTEEEKKLTVEAVLDYWLSQGAPREKLILGVALGGLKFTLVNPNENGIGAATRTHHLLGIPLPVMVIVTYTQICQLHKEGGWIIIFDDERRVPYSFKGDQWITYENIKSVRDKANYAAKMNLGGIAVAPIPMDDFRGICGVKYPLLNTVSEVLGNGSHVVEQPAEIITVAPKSV